MRTFTIAGIAAVLLVPVNAAAGDIAEKSVAAAIDAGFTEFERQIIEKYYGVRPAPREEAEAVSGATKHEERGGPKHGKGGKDLPPGLAKKNQLPPGLAKRDTLPPGLAKRDLPGDLEKQLPPPPEGYQRRIVQDVDGAAIVLIDAATGRIADIIKNVIIPDAK